MELGNLPARMICRTKREKRGKALSTSKCAIRIPTIQEWLMGVRNNVMKLHNVNESIESQQAII